MKGDKMDVELILKVCGVAMVITFVCNLLTKAGKDEQSTMVSLLGVVLILILLAEKVGVLISTLREVFGI
jgi:stage III sporulation protein AC